MAAVAAHGGNIVDTEGVEVLVAVGVAVDFSFVTLVGEALNVLTQLGLAVGGTTQEVLEVELNEAIGAVLVQKQTAVGVRLGEGGDQALNGEVAIHVEAFGRAAALFIHQVGVAEHLAVSRADHGLRISLAQVGIRGVHSGFSHQSTWCRGKGEG